MGARKGSRRLIDVPQSLLQDLELGRVSSATHVEHMAIDQSVLWAHTLSQAAKVPTFGGLGFIDRLRLGGRTLYEEFGASAWLIQPEEPDTVIAWRAFAVGAAGLDVNDHLAAIRPFAVHEHFAVREWAWLASRPLAVDQPRELLRALQPRLAGADDYWARFSSEVTRPRSVWGAHIEELKREPNLAEGVLSPLLRLHNRYVLTSASNWLNDVCRRHPAWVEHMCARSGTSDWVRRRSTRGLIRDQRPLGATRASSRQSAEETGT